jgi:hypothetical protein
VINVQDIATALKSAIKSWEVSKEINTMQEPDKAQALPTDAPVTVKWTGAVPTYKDPVSHRIFNYIRENQGLTAPQYADTLSKAGLIHSSVSSYIFQMLKSNLLYADENKRLYTKYTEYKTPKQIKPTPKKAKPPPKRKAKAKAKPTTVSVPQTVTLATPAPAVVRTAHVQQKIDSIDQDVEKIMATINLRTAYALFFILKKMFKE